MTPRLALAALLILTFLLPATLEARTPVHQTVGRRFTALPLASFSSDDGAGYGLRISLYEYNGKSVPYAWACSLQAFFTSKGKWVHRATLDYPNVTDSQQLTIDFVYDKENFALYSGELEDDVLDTYAEPQKTFKQKYPVLTVTWIKTLKFPWKMRIGLHAGHNTITPNANQGTTLARFSPLGHTGGSFYKAQFAIRYDTRDNYLNATRGLLEEALVEYGLGRSGTFKGGGVSYEHRQFLPLQKHWVFGYRVLNSATFGDLPFFERPLIGGSRTVRGLPKARLRGNGRVLINSELRWLGMQISKRLNLDLGGLVFYDAGHIFDPSEGPSTKNWRGGYGVGVRFYWYSTIVRMDYGFSGGNSGLYMRFAHIF